MKQQLKIYYTSDVHGYLFPTNYADTQEKNMGLLKCIPNFQKDENTLLIDGGDMLQGSALATYCQAHPEEGFPQAKALNHAGYDFVTLGNHDVNYGTSYLYQYLDALDATCVCENLLDAKSQTKKFPWAIKTLANGLKVGIVGVVTDYINVWEKAENIKDVTVSDPFTAAKQALEEVKSQVDLTICIYHGGFERDVKTSTILSKTSENIGYKICEELDFDLLLTGHQHLLIEGQLLHGTYIVQPSSNALNYFEINIEKIQNNIEITSTVGKPNTAPESNLMDELQPLETKVQEWLDQAIGQLNTDALAEDKLEMALYGSPVIELIGAVQLQASKAQITVVSLANTSPGFHKDVTMRDVIATYPYTNQLITLKITGAQLKQVVDKNGDYFSLNEQNEVAISPSYLYPKIEHYHFDFFVGIEYTIDLCQKAGKRVTALRYKNQLIKDNDEFTIALSDYRASGGGGFKTYLECPVIDEGAEEIVGLIIDYIQSQEEIVVPKNMYYKINHSRDHEL
ncbi:2',3'-cyclic-nucleotide 2'-phosphodiesterase/3'-nucleotidase [Enterococcus sp. DIV0840]|uniref:bifunctional metallophosphatase/5'-nucleotidase n=1 Tax=unclassified Enterococcus TaxID=2608891 RepID=UPI001A8CE8D7|nr:bifunctional UDP-sugar hydrolase/5'-nucleotidase [Enterococcus sp. DIV0849a]MBO0436028.1 bifunctional metallophosphatase/5'-nucleotidase [Enterococcus sp. DIV0849a]